MAIKFQPFFLSSLLEDSFLNRVIVDITDDVSRGISFPTPRTKSPVDALHCYLSVRRPVQEAVKDVRDHWDNLVGLDDFGETSNPQVVASTSIVEFLDVALKVSELKGV